jgi:hypothetical protein
VILSQAAAYDASAFAGAKKKVRDIIIVTGGEHHPVAFKSSDQIDSWLTRAGWRSVWRADQARAREVLEFDDLVSGVSYLPADQSFSATVCFPVAA